MARFNETHHAFISASFYTRLKADGAANWEEIYLYAVRLYGEQRGRRMAQRALRDGRPLDMASYRYYGEWSFTEDFLSTAPGFFEETEKSENYVYEVKDCPWNRVYQELGLPDGALLYCKDLDRAIARGFSPALKYEVERFPEGPILCRQIQYDARLDKDAGFPAPDPANKKDFVYHCGHIFAVFKTTLANCLGEKGLAISEAVLADFENRYGKEAAEALKEAAKADFELI